jgi:hypothetical protein
MMAPRDVLVPFDPREAMTVDAAAKIAGRNARTIRNWCIESGIGRRMAGGPWAISRPLFFMFIEDKRRELTDYFDGRPLTQVHVEYFERFGLGDLLRGR